MKWERIAPRCRQYAHKLRQALAGALELHRDSKWGRDEIEAAGLRDYARVFGHEVTPRHFWRLFDRVLRLDGGKRDFARLELYLPATISARPKTSLFEKVAAQMPDLSTQVQGAADPLNPSPAETQLIWEAACQEWQRLVSAGGSQVQAKKAVLAALDASGVTLARSYPALRRNLGYKIERWIEEGQSVAALRDRRAEKNRERRPLPLSDEDRKLLTARALTGSLARAWRESLANGELSSEATATYLGNPASKSYVPHRVRALIAPDVSMLDDIHHGPRQAALRGAYVSRDWSKVTPGDWYSADDTTLPLYYWEEGSDGRPRILRGQCLVMNDCRTNRVLAFALHSERNYTAKVIRGLILHTHDTYGLPREGYFFERGTWASARLLKGAADEVPGEETELGLREWVRFSHAKPGNAKAKTIERIIGLLQDRMEDQPGYCGRNEQTEKFERVQLAKREAEAGKRDVSGSFLHRDEWVQRLAQLCEAYNDEVQEGRMIGGMSPRAAWDQLFEHSRPLMKLTPETRYLLSNHRRPLKITRNGICVQLGKERRWFRDEFTGRNIGRTVQVYFDPERLESVFVKESPSDSFARVVPAAPEPPAMGATREELQSALESVAAQNQPARTLYQEIRPFFRDTSPSPFRRVVADADAVQLGRDIAADQDAIRNGQEQRGSIDRRLSSYRRRFGATPTQDAVDRQAQLEAYKLLEGANTDAD